MTPINQQTPGPLTVNGPFPEQIDYITLNAPSAGLSHVVRVNTLDVPSACLLAAAYSAFDKAGRELGIDAAELAESIDLAALILAAREVIGELDHDTLGAGTSARVLKLDGLLARLR